MNLDSQNNSLNDRADYERFKNELVDSPSEKRLLDLAILSATILGFHTDSIETRYKKFYESHNPTMDDYRVMLIALETFILSAPTVWDQDRETINELRDQLQNIRTRLISEKFGGGSTDPSKN